MAYSETGTHDEIDEKKKTPAQETADAQKEPLVGKEISPVIVKAEAPHARPDPNPERQRIIEQKTAAFKQEVQGILLNNAGNPRAVFNALNNAVGRQHIGGSEKYFTRDPQKAVDLEGRGPELYADLLKMDTIKNYSLYCLSCINLESIEMRDKPMLKGQIISTIKMFTEGTSEPFVAFGNMQEIFNEDIAGTSINVAPLLATCKNNDFLSDNRWLDRNMERDLQRAGN